MFEDAIAHREFALTGEALHRFRMLRNREAQGVIQGGSKQCEVADESVVVLKSRPVKAGNSVEDKTGMTQDLVHWGPMIAKNVIGCEGMKFIRRFLDLYEYP